MIIVTGSVTARPGARDELLALSLDHVRRSREEPGCLLHSVHVDAEDDHRLVFLEHWQDADALAAHFAVPEAGAFVRAAMELAASPPTLEIYEATPTAV